MTRLKFFYIIIVVLLSVSGCRRHQASSLETVSSLPDSLIRVDIFYDGDICPWTTDRIVSGKVSDYVCDGNWTSFIDESGNEFKVYVKSNASRISLQSNTDLQEFKESLSKMSPIISTHENVDCWFGVLLFYSGRVDTLAVGIHPEGLISINSHSYHNPDILRILTRKISVSDPNWTSLIKRSCTEDDLEML